MWFLVVFVGNNSTLTSAKANLTQLLNKYDFGNFYGDVVQFTQRAGIGDVVQVQERCVIVRIR